MFISSFSFKTRAKKYLGISVMNDTEAMHGLLFCNLSKIPKNLSVRRMLPLHCSLWVEALSIEIIGNQL